MGNQLVSSVKTVIRPIDFYLNEVPDFKFKCSLGQTQFLKVALCVHNGNDIVVKVLSHEDPSLLLEQYKHELTRLAKLTSKNVSIASFRLFEIRQNFAYIARQYIRYSLYDRLSSRPFLTEMEKSWILFQIFKCMQWCHENNIYHGDIKLENILITSNLWVVISDFASYKPIRLPDDNPTFFNYFFDTSRRRCCNIAPERFVSPNFNNQIRNMSLGSINYQQKNANIFSLFLQEGHLTEKMDMFSLGCVLAEFYSDNFLFDLAGLLSYKEGKRDRIEEALDKIQNTYIRDIVENLINLDPDNRMSCLSVIEKLNENFFPKYFEQLYSLIRTLIRQSPDYKIIYLDENINQYLDIIENENPIGLLIILMTLTSTIRGLKHVSCKLKAQRLICKIATSSSKLAPYIVDRLIPYMVHFLDDKEQRIRGESIESIAQLLEHVDNLPSSDNNLFTDYLMERFQKCIVNEKSTYVRICMAKNIGRLAFIALKYLNQYYDHNFKEELHLLQKYFQNLVSMLITDSNNCVRRVLLVEAKNCSKLCSLFGRNKTNEIILSHLITFLNDKNDFKLRLAFFDNIMVIASYLGVECASILEPLLQQGLCDYEEIIIAKTIETIGALYRENILSYLIIIDFLKEIMPLVYHPNDWILNSIIKLLALVKNNIDLVEWTVKIQPIFLPYFRPEATYYLDDYVSKHKLKAQIPRNIYETILFCKDQETLLAFFNHLSLKYSKGNLNDELLLNNSIYKRLMAENICVGIEKKILTLSDLMIKIYRNRKNYNTIIKQHDEPSNIIYLKKYNLSRCKEIPLVNYSASAHYSEDHGAEHTNQATNPEWLQMFGPHDNNVSHSYPSSNVKSSMGFKLNKELMQSELKANEFKNPDLFVKCPPYARDVQMLEYHKKQTYMPFLINENYSTNINRPKGIMLASIYDHKGCVNQMTQYNNEKIFITCSNDGSIRLWDIIDYPISHSLEIRSLHKYFGWSPEDNFNLSYMGVICCDRYIISYTNECKIIVFEIDWSRLLLTCSFKISQNINKVVLITGLCRLSQNLFAVSLTDSSIYIYDTRLLLTPYFNVPIMKIQLSAGNRYITSIDGNELILFSGTSRGSIYGFDLRFKLKVCNYLYDSKKSTQIAKLKYTPYGLLSSVYGNLDVTLWDYKFSQKSKILSPLNSHTEHDNSHNKVINAIFPLITPSSASVITGGTDMRLIHWDLTEPEQSYVIGDIYRSMGNSVVSTLINAETAKSYSNPHLENQLTNSSSHGNFDDEIGSRYGCADSIRKKRISQKNFSFNQEKVKMNNLSESRFSGFYRNNNFNKIKNFDEDCNDNGLLIPSIAITTDTSPNKEMEKIADTNTEAEGDSGDECNKSFIPHNPKRSAFKITNQDCIMKIEEIEIASTKPSSINNQESDGNMDFELYSVQHDDSIIDIISVSDYLISCGRNGIVNIWQ